MEFSDGISLGCYSSVNIQCSLSLGEISECHIPNHIFTLVYTFIVIAEFLHNKIFIVYITYIDFYVIQLKNLSCPNQMEGEEICLSSKVIPNPLRQSYSQNILNIVILNVVILPLPPTFSPKSNKGRGKHFSTQCSSSDRKCFAFRNHFQYQIQFCQVIS